MHTNDPAGASPVDCRVVPLVERLRDAARYGLDPSPFDTVTHEAADEIERLRGLLRRALPMADALDATKTAVVWTIDIQCDASMLVRDIRLALGPNV
jgi:hypothetical protein